MGKLRGIVGRAISFLRNSGTAENMSPAQKMAQTINGAPPRLKRGSLQFFGEWFGRPGDNNHSIVAAEADENRLRLTFDDDETLDVWDPKELELQSDQLFVIRSASRVRWEWFHYGESKTPDNRHFIEYRYGDNAIQRRADRPASVGPATANPHRPAVTIN
ncbi:MAG TPA: hypothetical protein VG318_04295 [Actinomycetota bacterium]|nr:hypothetical protein [Actinomycetota bacterium]